MHRLICFFWALLWVIAGSTQSIDIIPVPSSVKKGVGSFTLSKETIINVSDEGDHTSANFLNDYLKQFYHISLNTGVKEASNSIHLVTRKFIKAPDKDAYTLTVSKDGIVIEGDTYAGTFYGIQTLIQLLPVMDKVQMKNGVYTVPVVQISDAPRFAYRGMHLDVARHFFPVSFVKKYIDYLALHKMNYFHWHLTDDQGWRIEIKKYPKLVEVGSCRNGTIIGRYPGRGNDSVRYCGYYTQQEIKEVVKYASNRHITVVPEIEMPGHASAALTSYPWLGCPGTGPYKVEETWGVFDDVFCAGNDSTFMFLQDVMDEVLSLFPSPYIHVGGDECPKNNWKSCPRCQARIKAEGLKDEHELQSYFIRRMEKFINAKGRTLIGWDEILEGGLAQNAVVMSWRGIDGGIAAARQKHDVIMTPSTHLYFDFAQSTSEDSVTIGNYTPVQKTYSYEPVPKELNEEQAKYIIGAQANVWTEYMGNPQKVEYMVFPRMSALSEVQWSEKEKKNWPDFEKRMRTQYQRYQLWNADYSKAFYEVQTTIGPTPNYNGILVQLSDNDQGGKLMYAISGVHYPKIYSTPVVIQQNTLLTGLYYKGNQLMDSLTLDIKWNKATGKKITVSPQPSSGYAGDGAFTLVNGIWNVRGLERGREFIGYRGTAVEIVIDLDSVQTVNEVAIDAITTGGSRVYPPQSLEVYFSGNGKNYTVAGSSNQLIETMYGKGKLALPTTGVATRYVKLIVKPVMKIAEGRLGAGENAWMFLDEVEIK